MTDHEIHGADEDFHEGYVTEERAEECFITGLQAMREMLARFVGQGGDTTTANSIRLNWNSEWGQDPGRPDEIALDCWGTTQGLLDRGWERAQKIIEAHKAKP